MKTEYNPLDRPSLLYNIIEELVFLEQIKKITNYFSNTSINFITNLKTRFKKFTKSYWGQASLILTGYMTFSSLLLFVAYKMVMIF